MKKELISSNPHLPSLTSFIKMITMLSDKFEMSITSIGNTNTDSRDMSCYMEGDFGNVDLDYRYYDSEFYITVYRSGRNEKSLEDFKTLLKTEVEK